MIHLLSRLLSPLAAALLREPPVRHALIRAIAEQEAANQAVREQLLLSEQARRNSHFSAWLAEAGNRTP
jgi:hypothetical protein